MGRLADIELRDLHGLLDEVEGKEPTQRVLAAIGRKQGLTLAALAEQHDVAEKTIRNWLDRFSERPLADAPYDAERSGRPGKLSRSQRETVFEHLRGPPAACGYERARWSPELVQEHLRDRWAVDYSRRHVYRLLEAAERSSDTEGLRHGRADSDAGGPTEGSVDQDATDT